ncbi:MAG: LysM peptidoglycan-binding domain-containing protein [Alcaligenaceae bacterium]|nr:LysM peptidoglycan-binding domain-containing protein [Alcaligenaceae bacterium]
MSTVLKILGNLLLLLLLLLVSWAFVLYEDWPLWATFALTAMVVAVVLLARLSRRIWITRRARFKLAQSEGAAQRNMGNPLLLDLTNKWKAAIELLRKSSLRRFGNPLRVLPWYLVVGESGSGKTTAITRTHLTSVIKNILQSAPIIQTMNFDWWFFSKAIVIDTAGRYVSPQSVESDQLEWEKLLELLARSRPKDGLDGLVVVIDAERLLQNDSELLALRGRVLRERIDQLIRLFDKRFPIYVLITKSDLISGFTSWVDTLAQEQLEQALGYLGNVKQGDGSETDFLAKAFASITDRLKHLRLELGMKGVDLSSEVLLFPAELERVRPGLQQFLSACVGNNPYLEQPLLRGIFFASGKQASAGVSGILGETLRPAPLKPIADRGLFLHDFFGSILPRDRGTFLPTQIVNRWNQITRNLAWVSWLAVNVAVVSFLLLSYTATKTTLTQIEVAFPVMDSRTQGDIHFSRQRLTALLQIVDLLLLQEHGWNTQWLAFSDEVRGLQDDIKVAFGAGMTKVFARDSVFDQRIDSVLAQPDSAAYPEIVRGLVRYYNKSIAGLRGATYDEMLEMPKVPGQALRALDPGLSSDVIAGYDRLISAYFAWAEPGDPALVTEAKHDFKRLSEVVFAPGKMGWLLTWIDQQPEMVPVTLTEFWVPDSARVSGFQIRPAFTHAGHLRIESFLDELATAFDNSAQFANRRESFERWYHAERISAWHAFATKFSEGENLLVGEPTWRAAVRRANSFNSPYYTFIRRLEREFAEVAREELPGWLQFSRDFTSFRADAQKDATLVNRASTLVGVINQLGGRALKESVSEGSVAPTSGQMTQALGTIDSYRKFITGFDTAAAAAIEGEGSSSQMAGDLFAYGLDPSVKLSTLSSLQEAFSAFRSRSGYDSPEDAVLWPLVSGPLQLLIRYVTEQASCSIQKDWEKSVLWRLQTVVSAKESGEQLFGSQGTVWMFAAGPAKPYLQQKSTEFQAVTASGYRSNASYKFPFSQEFIPFLNQSVGLRVGQLVKDQRAENAKGKSVKLTIAAKPLGVNASAKAKPFAATLSLQCANEEIVLNNFNIQTSDTITWSPDLCGDVSLQIKIDNLLLTRRYPGVLGLARFIEEFQDGERLFTPEDFPALKEQLDGQEVTSINVRYDFVGQQALLKLAEDYSHLTEATMATASAGALALNKFGVPNRVGQCWTTGQPPAPYMDVPRIIEERVAQAMKPVVNSAVAVPVIPSVAATASVAVVAAAPSTAVAAKQWNTHLIDAGDNLTKLALKYGTTVQALQSLNQLSNTVIKVGDTLKIPLQ